MCKSFVSVIIPAMNEEKYILKCLESLQKLDYPKDLFEIIVIDNGSSDNTVKIATDFGAKCYVNKGVKVGAVRNYGAKITKGDLLAFVDADCEVGEDWLKSATKSLLDVKTGAVGGGCLAPAQGNWMERAWTTSEAGETSLTNALAASSFIIRRDTFDEISGFNEIIAAGEDDEISKRLIDAGYKLISKKECWVIHWGYPKAAKEVIKRQVWHGSNQINVAGTIFEPLIILTHVFLLGLITILVSILSFCFIGFLVGMTLMFFPSSVMALKKSYSEGSIGNLLLISQRTLIYFYFFTGRVGGLVLNYKALYFN